MASQHRNKLTYYDLSDNAYNYRSIAHIAFHALICFSSNKNSNQYINLDVFRIFTLSFSKPFKP